MSGAAHAAFRRALNRGSLAHAKAAAHDLPVISLADALELVLLTAERDPLVFDRAAARWLAGFVRENRGVTLTEAGLVHAALTGIGGKDPRAGLLALLAVAERRRLRDIAELLKRRLRS